MNSTDPDAPIPSAADQATTRHVRRAADGDAESLAWIFERFTPALLLQARYRLERLPRRLLDPEDLVQDVWLRALAHLPALPARDGRYTPVLMRFLSTALLNRVNTLVQKHLRGKPPVVPIGASADDSAPPLELSAAATGALTRAARSERAHELHTALGELGDADREILVLRGIEQSANQTVATILGLEPNTVAARYRRALQRARKCLPGSLFEELD